MLRPLGELFIRLLQMMVLPIVVSTIIAGLSAISVETLSRIGLRTIAWYLSTALAATLIGVAVALALRPGAGLKLPAPAAAAGPVAPPTLGTILTGLVPENIIAAMSRGELLSVVLFSFLFALAVAALRQSGETRVADVIHEFFDAVARVAYRMLYWVMQYAPVGIFALIAITFGQRDAAAITQFAKTIAAVWLGQLLVCVGCVLLLVVRRINVAGFGGAARDPLLTAWVTGSSAATLPVEMDAAERGLRVERSLAAFALPLGVSIHKIGTAVHLGVVTMFAAYAAGVGLAPSQLAVIILLSFLAAVGTPPISGGAFLMLGFIFSQAGLPPEAIAVVAGIPFLGKWNTPVNSLGRLVVTVVVARAEEGRGPADGAPTILSR